MSDKIARSVYYYELLAKKYDTDGIGEHQARVYGELAALVGECSSLEEIQERMRAQGYLEKPGQALYLDKLAAHVRAAEDNGLPELARIYQKKFDDIQKDPAAAFVTGWEQEAAGELNRVGNIVGALTDIFAAHLRYRGTHPADDAHARAVDAMHTAARVIQDNGTDFATVVDHPYFRKHSPLDDARYERARDEILAVLAGNADAQEQAADREQIVKRTQTAVTILESKTDELKEIGREFDQHSGRAVWLNIAPESEPGPYQREAFYTE